MDTDDIKNTDLQTSIEKLKTYIPWLEQEKGKSHPEPSATAGEEEKEAYWQFESTLHRFIVDFYESPFDDHYYNSTLEKYPHHVSSLADGLKDATLEETMAIFTLLIRADYFSEGAAEASVEDGDFLKVLLRLSELVGERESGNEK